MKVPLLLIFFITLFCCSFTKAQDNLNNRIIIPGMEPFYRQSLDAESGVARIKLVCQSPENKRLPLLIVTVDSMRLLISDSRDATDTLSGRVTLNQINHDWIESVEILKSVGELKDHDASEADCALLISLKTGSLSMMPATLREKFKPF